MAAFVKNTTSINFIKDHQIEKKTNDTNTCSSNPTFAPVEYTQERGSILRVLHVTLFAKDFAAK